MPKKHKMSGPLDGEQVKNLSPASARNLSPASTRDRAVSAPSDGFRSSRRRSSVADWAEAVFVRVSRRGSSQAYIDRALGRFSHKAQAFDAMAEWVVAQATHSKYVEKLISLQVEVPGQRLHRLRMAVKALTLQGQAEERYADSLGECHGLLLPLGRYDSQEELSSRSAANTDEETLAFRPGEWISERSELSERVGERVEEAATAAGAQVSAAALAARDRAHTLSHAAASLRCERKELADEMAAVEVALDSKLQTVARLLDTVREASLALGAAVERQRALVGYASGPCSIEDDLWLQAHRMAHAADAYASSTLDLSRAAADLGGRLQAASERAGRSMRDALRCCGGEESAASAVCAHPRAERGGGYVWGKPEQQEGDAAPMQPLPPATPMPPPSGFCLRSGALTRLRPASLGRAEEWISEWAVLTADGFLHLFPHAHSQVALYIRSHPIPSDQIDLIRSHPVSSHLIMCRLVLFHPLLSLLSRLISPHPT